MKKKLNIILLILVVSLWAAVIYRFASQYFLNNNIDSLQNEMLVFSDLKIVKKDTFNLNPIERDPFLNSSFSFEKKPVRETIKHNLSNTIKANPIPINASAKEPFPLVECLGYIKSSNKENELFLLKINGKLTKVKLNEITNGLKISKVYKDSIKLDFFKESKYVKYKR